MTVDRHHMDEVESNNLLLRNLSAEEIKVAKFEYLLISISLLLLMFKTVKQCVAKNDQ